MKIEDLQTTVNKLSSQDVRSMFQTGRGKQKITIPATGTSWNMMFSIARQARGGAVGPAGIKKNKRLFSLFGSAVLYWKKHDSELDM